MGGDLGDFGKDVRAPYPKDNLRAEVAPSSPGASNNGFVNMGELSQWAVCGPHQFMGITDTVKSMPAGVYTVALNPKGEIFFGRVDTKVDDLMEFPDSVHERILNEIGDFWGRNDKFREYGFLHRRGYLFYGPAGSGKTGIVSQVIARIVKSGDIVFLCGHPKSLAQGLSQFRQIEPSRRVVCVFEDIDAIIKEYGEEMLLSLLDGENQIDCCLNIATTNYPERLDPRIVARPRRFDRVERIGMPEAPVRRLYLSKKFKIAPNDPMLDQWVEKTNGLSFAAIAETVISVKCLGNELDETLKILRNMAAARATSDEFNTKKVGIHA